MQTDSSRQSDSPTQPEVATPAGTSTEPQAALASQAAVLPAASATHAATPPVGSSGHAAVPAANTTAPAAAMPGQAPAPEQFPDDALDRPSLQAALALLLPVALSIGVAYLWFGKLEQAALYGGLVGAGLAAIVVEFVKYGKSLNEHPEGGGSAWSKAGTLAMHAFRLGFVRTFKEVISAIFQVVGVKALISVVIAVLAFFAVKAGHLL